MKRGVIEVEEERQVKNESRKNDFKTKEEVQPAKLGTFEDMFLHKQKKKQQKKK